jgi:hypothetical protein
LAAKLLSGSMIAVESVVNVKAPLLLMRGLCGGKLVSSAHDKVACRKAMGEGRNNHLKKRGIQSTDGVRVRYRDAGWGEDDQVACDFVTRGWGSSEQVNFSPVPLRVFFE